MSDLAHVQIVDDDGSVTAGTVHLATYHTAGESCPNDCYNEDIGCPQEAGVCYRLLCGTNPRGRTEFWCVIDTDLPVTCKRCLRKAQP